MIVVHEILSQRELERRKKVLAERKRSKPEPKRRTKGTVKFVGKLDDYSGLKLKGLAQTYRGKMDVRCPHCQCKGLTQWKRRVGGATALCPRCGWSGKAWISVRGQLCIGGKR